MGQRTRKRSFLMDNGTLLAAIDLGSNSYRLEIGRYDHGHIHRVEYLKETVRQGGGLDEARNLTPEAMQRGWDCLARFAERLAVFHPSQVRAVATQTLREARNREVFLLRARSILGFPIEVVSGREEARLIYMGVSHLLPQSDERRLVVDVGGRSTEIIVGRGHEPRVMESYRVGSVAWSIKHFPQGDFTASAFERAEVAAKAILDESLAIFPRGSWDIAYGSSGTLGAIADVLGPLGVAPGLITLESLHDLRERLLAARHADRVRLEGLREDRKPVIAGGLSVVLALFDLLGITHMQAAEGALRQGVLYDLLDRDHGGNDQRSLTVERLALRFGVDLQQAQRVEQASHHFSRQLAHGHRQAEKVRRQRELAWAAHLHEIGCMISHSDYHKHGAYVLDHSDASGFTQSELHRLSLLVLGHRGKLRKLEAAFEDEDLIDQLLCLRLAVILCHARREPQLKGLQLRKQPEAFLLQLPRDWPGHFPQSAHLLREEMTAWLKMPRALRVEPT